ncbi:hypothetical protein BGX38DRAFT_1276833 [Terfezia claveryi]|nr:hypothetical protein BGX38DRAFT_1276833 [Terfezia claveryi]
MPSLTGFCQMIKKEEVNLVMMDKELPVLEVTGDIPFRSISTQTGNGEEVEEEWGSRKDGKRKERAKGSGSAGGTPLAKSRAQEDVQMLDEGRFAQHEDLSDYEKESADEAPVAPPVTTKPTECQVERQGSETPAAKYRKPAKPVEVDDEYVNTRAFVVNGIPCQRPMADTTQNVRKTECGDYRGTLAAGRSEENG